MSRSRKATVIAAAPVAAACLLVLSGSSLVPPLVSWSVWPGVTVALGEVVVAIAILSGVLWVGVYWGRHVGDEQGGSGSDVVDVKGSEALVLQETRLRLEAAVTAGRVGLWDWDLDTGEVFYSSEWKSQIGYEEHEIGTGFEEWESRVHPEDLAPTLEKIRRHIDSGERSYEVEFRFRHRAGHYLWILAQATVIRDEGGRAIRVLGSHVDITPLKDSQETSDRYRWLLQEAECLAGLGAWEWDFGTDEWLLSEGWRQVHGTSEELAKTDDLVVLVHPSSREEVEKGLAQLRRGERRLEIELRIVRASDGEVRQVRASAETLCDHDGRPVRAIGVVQDITDQRRADENFLRLCNMAQELICIADIHTATFVQVNPAFEDLLGYSQAELLGQPFLNFVHPDDVEATEAVMREKLLAGDPVISFENRYRCKDGSYRYLQWNSNPLREEGLTYAIAHDITDRKAMEQARRESEERYRAMFEKNRSVKLLIDPSDGRILDANPAAEHFYGYERDQLLRMKISDINTLSEAAVKRKMKAAASEEEGYFRFVHRLASDELREVEVHSSPLMISGRTVLYSIVHDVTARVRVEQALLESEEKYRTIFEHAPLGLFRSTSDGRFIEVNRALAELLGYESPEAVLAAIHDIGSQVYVRSEERLAIVRDHLRGQNMTHHVNRYRRRDGSEFVANLYLKTIRNESGEPLYLEGIVEDITARLEAEGQREALEEQLRQAQKMEAVGRLAGGVAHDFNNKLQTILGYSDMLLSTISQDHPFHEQLELIRTAAQQSASLTRQLLGFARKQTITPKVLELNGAISGMLKMLERLVGEQVELDWRPGEQVSAVKMDPTQLDQVLTNLIVNARDAIEGSGTIVIETREAMLSEAYCQSRPGMRAGCHAVLEVRDDGVGMDPQTISRIFEPFYTSKPQEQGTGLGLATVYGIVTQNHGTVEVDSELGTGSTFRVYLPIVASEAGGSEHEESIPRAYESSETVLLVEDDESILQLGRRVLEEMGYVVLPASSPSVALELAEVYPGHIGLVITDVIMPGMSGPELLAKLRERCPELRCLFVSGYSADIIAPHGVLDEGTNFLQKPFTRESLVSSIRHALQPVEASARPGTGSRSDTMG